MGVAVAARVGVVKVVVVRVVKVFKDFNDLNAFRSPPGWRLSQSVGGRVGCVTDVPYGKNPACVRYRPGL